MVLVHGVRHQAEAGAQQEAAQPAARGVSQEKAVRARIPGTQRPAHLQPRQAAHGSCRAQAPMVRQDEQRSGAAPAKETRSAIIDVAQDQENKGGVSVTWSWRCASTVDVFVWV